MAHLALMGSGGFVDGGNVATASFSGCRSEGERGGKGGHGAHLVYSRRALKWAADVVVVDDVEMGLGARVVVVAVTAVCRRW